MSSPPDDRTDYVLTVEAARWAVRTLGTRRTHPFFIAYLQLRRQAARQQTRAGIEPHWEELVDLLRVEGGPTNRPMLRPFVPLDMWAPDRLWMNANIAGSFAPSSIRDVPRRVIATSGSKFELREDDAEKALHEFLYGEPLGAIALATFLFRDFGFSVSRRETPWIGDLEFHLRTHFGFEPRDRDFDILFDASVPDVPFGAWFERFDFDVPGAM